MKEHTIIITPRAIESLRRKAKRQAKISSISYCQLLDKTAEHLHCQSWSELQDHAVETQAANNALKHGFVIGMDMKDAMEAGDVSGDGFIEDSRIQYLIIKEIESQYPDFQEEDTDGFYLREDAEGMMFYRYSGESPKTIEEALKMCKKAFFFPLQYIRLNGHVWTPYDEDGCALIVIHEN
jgi:hypothetical protein